MPSEPKHDDADLMRRVTCGDAEAFAVLYDRHGTLVFSVALKILGDFEESRDVLQHVFLTLHNKAALYNPAFGHAAAWLTTLARNRALDRVRELKTRRQCLDRLQQETEACDSTPENCAMLADEIGHLRAAVKALPAEQRRALELAYFGGLTQQEISDVLAEPLGTVKARIRRGLLRLRETLSETLI